MARPDSRLGTGTFQMNGLTNWLKPSVDEQFESILPWLRKKVLNRSTAARQPPAPWSYTSDNLRYASVKPQTLQIVKILSSNRICKVLLSDSFSTIEAIIAAQPPSRNPTVTVASIGGLISISRYELVFHTFDSVYPVDISLFVQESELSGSERFHCLGHPKPLAMAGGTEAFSDTPKAATSVLNLGTKSPQENKHFSTQGDEVLSHIENSLNIATQPPFVGMQSDASKSAISPYTPSNRSTPPLPTTPTSLLSGRTSKRLKAVPSLMTRKSANTTEDLMGLVGSKKAPTGSWSRLEPGPAQASYNEGSAHFSMPQAKRAVDSLCGTISHSEDAQPKHVSGTSPKTVHIKEEPVSPLMESQNFLSGRDSLLVNGLSAQDSSELQLNAELLQHYASEQGENTDSGIWKGMESVLRRDVDIPKDQRKVLDGEYSWLPPEPGTDEPMVPLPSHILRWLDEKADDAASEATILEKEQVPKPDDLRLSSSSPLPERNETDENVDVGSPVTNWSLSPLHHRRDYLPPDSSAEVMRDRSIGKVSRTKRQRSLSMDEDIPLSKKNKVLNSVTRMNHSSPSVSPSPSHDRGMIKHRERNARGTDTLAQQGDCLDALQQSQEDLVHDTQPSSETQLNVGKSPNKEIPEARRSQISPPPVYELPIFIRGYYNSTPMMPTDESDLDSDEESEPELHTYYHPTATGKGESGKTGQSNRQSPLPFAESENSYLQVHRTPYQNKIVSDPPNHMTAKVSSEVREVGSNDTFVSGTFEEGRTEPQNGEFKSGTQLSTGSYIQDAAGKIVSQSLFVSPAQASEASICPQNGNNDDIPLDAEDSGSRNIQSARHASSDSPAAGPNAEACLGKETKFNFSQEDRHVANLSERLKQHRRDFMKKRAGSQSAHSSLRTPVDQQRLEPESRRPSQNGKAEQEISRFNSDPSIAGAASIRSSPKNGNLRRVVGTPPSSQKIEDANAPMRNTPGSSSHADGVSDDNRQQPLRQELCQIFPGTNSPLELFQHFRNAYPEYQGSFKHFSGVCNRIHQLTAQGQLFPQCLWDDFIVRHNTEYRSYLAECHSNFVDPDKYESYYQNITSIRYTGNIITRQTLKLALRTASSSSSTGDSKDRRSSGSTYEDALTARTVSYSSSVPILNEEHQGSRVSSRRSEHPRCSSRPRPSSQPPQTNRQSEDRPLPLDAVVSSQASRKRLNTEHLPSDRPHKKAKSIPKTSQPTHVNVEHFPGSSQSNKSRRSSKSTAHSPRHTSSRPSSRLSQGRSKSPITTTAAAAAAAAPVQSARERSYHSARAADPHRSSAPLVSSAPAPQSGWWQDTNTPFKMFARAYTSLKSVNGAIADVDDKATRPINVLEWEL
ncbi:hypothetical protein L228DRAFT_281284 [Xylona heveae TC161]|uniref:Telomere replication protein EST3 n=1 Tax=Xylona heveae (strain CBS 132557 / TC161) TaxID=1328760 RepID=A0A165I0F3_XYLHT|nr:hypothetical protein L228DRAFT_281284 [Xylona heveae TC161]KZF24181.1 hypothetical protein L228DRAFT_281284 [Xylona heveae TC161]